MSRISKADVNNALDLAGRRIIDAGGADSRVSRADVQKALSTLEGTEKALVDVFFKFMDHRDHRAGATITATDVNRAVAYAKEKLIAKYDLNNNGLSKSEISQMSFTGQLAVELSQALKATVVPAPSDPVVPGPVAEGVVQNGLSFYELRQRVTIDSEQRFTTPEGVDATLAQQFINACHTSSYTHVQSLSDAFGAVDGGEFVVRNFTDPVNGKAYTAIDYGAGDSTYGAIFEAGSTGIAFDIQDGELWAK